MPPKTKQLLFWIAPLVITNLGNLSFLIGLFVSMPLNLFFHRSLGRAYKRWAVGMAVVVGRLSQIVLFVKVWHYLTGHELKMLTCGFEIRPIVG